MGLVARLLAVILWPLTWNSSPNPPMPTAPSPDPDGPEVDLTDHIDSLDDDAIALWVDYLEECLQLDSSKHYHQ